MKQSSLTRYTYLAGIIDGEGCIRINKTNKNKPYYISQITVDQKDGRLIDWLYGNFGGSINEIGGNESKTKQYRWTIYGTKVKDILKKIIPFLTIKKHQAEILLRYQIHKEIEEKKYRNSDGTWKNISENEIKLRESLYQQLSYLKKKYYLSRALVTTKRINGSSEPKQ